MGVNLLCRTYFFYDDLLFFVSCLKKVIIDRTPAKTIIQDLKTANNPHLPEITVGRIKMDTICWEVTPDIKWNLMIRKHFNPVFYYIVLII